MWKYLKYLAYTQFSALKSECATGNTILVAETFGCLIHVSKIKGLYLEPSRFILYFHSWIPLRRDEQLNLEDTNLVWRSI